MSNPLTETRARVAAALAAGLTVPLYDQPPTGPLSAPCVVITPGSPWLTPRGHVTLDIVAHASNIAGNSHALDRLEAVVFEVQDALYAAGLPVGDTAQPTTQDTGTIAARTPITLRVDTR